MNYKYKLGTIAQAKSSGKPMKSNLIRNSNHIKTFNKLFKKIDREINNEI